MGNVEYLDRDGFVKNQGFLKEAAQYFSNCSIQMFGSADHYYIQDMMAHYDGLGEVTSGASRFKDALRRLTDLRDAMDTYLEEWEAAQENATGLIGNIEGGTDAYNGPVFSDIYAVEVAAGPNYQLSPAYHFTQSGKSFSADYNDLGGFIWTSDYGKKTRVKWGATQFSNKENYWEFVENAFGGGDGNYELMNNALTASLESMLKQLPGYEGADVNFDVLNWDDIGDELGVPGLGNWMKAVLKVLSALKQAEIKGVDVDPECYEELARFLEEWDYQMCDIPWLSTFVENTTYALVGFSKVGNGVFKHVSKFAGELASVGKTAMTVQEFSEFTTKMLFHMCSNHSLQVGYLESFRESLEASGFTSGVVIEKLEQLERQYSDKMVYFTEKLFDKAYDQAFGSISGAISEIPGLKSVTLGMDLISGVAKIAWGEETGAMNTLMGLYQYDEVLTRTFENYTALMEQGIATEEDVKRANDLFDILVITKKQEYENILKIVDDKKSEWYIMATEKLEELNNLPSSLDLASEAVLNMPGLGGELESAKVTSS